MAEISMWYHGTSRDSARLIVQRGLTAANYGLDPHGLGSAYHVLARQREQVLTAWASAGAIVIVHVPDDEQAEYLTCLASTCCCGGNLSGLLKPLPARMVRFT